MIKLIPLSFAAVLLAESVLGADNWPQFRGPHGNGHSEAKGLPVTWSETQNVKWKTPIHGRAWSSPVVWNDQVWLTTATEDGRELSALCVDRNSGKVVHDRKLFDVANPQFAHKFNTYGSPTPVIEEGSVYVTFGSPGTACLDTKTGKVLWERRDFVCNHFRGAGSSPILFQDLLIMNFDGSDYQFIVALDKRSGKTVWKEDRSIDFKDLLPNGKPEADGDWRKSYATPHVAMFGGKPVLLSSGAKAHYAYEPLTGTELWRVEERSCHSAASRPVIGHGLFFIPAGFSKGLLLAIQPPEGQPGGHSVIDLSKATGPDPVVRRDQVRLAWKSTRNAPNKPSVSLIGDLLFMIDDGGIASCLEAKTGAEVWRERVGGNYSASPVDADGKIYFFSEEGKGAVIAADRQFKVLAENKLDDGFMASPAIAGKALFLRTKTHLYRIEQ
ncbi:MAG: quinonprotein alcohol dehydrogenase [Verrucomicrobia bacterium]|nr:quinonprotein alcohol dehydrogenase [Verrucomicrobiota bacterium]